MNRKIICLISPEKLGSRKLCQNSSDFPKITHNDNEQHRENQQLILCSKLTDLLN